MLSNKPFHIYIILSTILVVFFSILLIFGLYQGKPKIIKLGTWGSIASFILLAASAYFVNFYN